MLNKNKYIIGFICLFVILYFPSLFTGFSLDDYLILSKLSEPSSFLCKIVHLYEFIPPHFAKIGIQNGLLPWWSNSNLIIAFFRPLTSLTFIHDYHFFGKTAIFYHLHSMLWFIGFLTLWYVILKQLHLSRLVLLSFFILICSNIYLVPVMWISNRHVLTAGFFSLLALLFYQYWSNYKKYVIYFLSLFAFLCSFLSSEIALSGFVYLFFYEILLTERTWQKKIIALFPFLIGITVYFICYTHFNFGVKSSGLYIDPFINPLLFIKALLIRIPDIFSLAIININSSSSIGTLNFSFDWISQVFFLILLFILFFISIRSYRNKTYKELFWLSSSTFISTIPLVTANTQSRLLIFTFLGLSVMLACMIQYLWRFHLIGKVLVSIILFQRFILIPISLLINTLIFNNGNQQQINYAQKILPKCESLITVQAPYELSPFFMIPLRSFLELPNPKQWYALSMTTSSYEFNNTKPNIYDLTIKEGLFTNTTSYIFNNNPLNFSANKSIDTNLFSAKILKTNKNGPSKIRFRFKKQISEGCFYMFSM